MILKRQKIRWKDIIKRSLTTQNADKEKRVENWKKNKQKIGLLRSASLGCQNLIGDFFIPVSRPDACLVHTRTHTHKHTEREKEREVYCNVTKKLRTDFTEDSAHQFCQF